MTTPKDLVESQLPNYFYEQYPQFIKFVEEYYNFLESSIIVLSDNKKLSEGDLIYGSLSKAKAVVKIVTNNRIYFDYITEENQFYKNEVIFNGDTGEIYFIRSLYKNIYQYMNDIEDNTSYDTALNVFKKYFKNNVSLDESVFKRVDPKTLTKRILDYYKNKDTENSYYWFFRIFFEDDIELYYPKVDILRLSDSGYTEKNLVQIKINRDGSTFSNARIVGTVSGATATCKNTVSRYLDNTFRGFLDLIYINGTFVKDETIIAYDISTGVEKGRTQILESIIGVKPIDGGIGHSVGDKFTFDDGMGRISKLKKHSVTKIDIKDSGVCYRVGDPIVFDNEFTGATYSAKAKVTAIDVNPTLTQFFNSYYNTIKNRPVSTFQNYNLNNTVFSGSNTFQNTNSLQVLPVSFASDYEVGSIKEIKFEDSGLGYELPPRTTAFNSLTQASLLNYFDVLFDTDVNSATYEANAQYIVANTSLTISGATNVPNDETLATCIGEVDIDTDETPILFNGISIKSENVRVKRFVTQRSATNLENDTDVTFTYNNTQLTAEIKDLVNINPLSDTAVLESKLGDGISELKIDDVGLMVDDTDEVIFKRPPETLTFYDSLIEHGLTGKLEYETGLLFEPFGDFLNNDSMLSSNKYFFDNYYYQHYSYEIITKIPADLIEPLLLDELHPAGFLAFIRNKFEFELETRIKTFEFTEIENETAGYLQSEIYPHMVVQIEKDKLLNKDDFILNDNKILVEPTIQVSQISNETITTKDHHRVEIGGGMDGIPDIFATFKYFIDDIVINPLQSPLYDFYYLNNKRKSSTSFDKYLTSEKRDNLITEQFYYDGLISVESFMKIVNVEDEANWRTDLIKYKAGPIDSAKDKTIDNFRITIDYINRHTASFDRGGMIIVRDISDYTGNRTSEDDVKYSNTSFDFSETAVYKPLISGNSLNGEAAYLPTSEILTRDRGWVMFKNLTYDDHVADVSEKGIVKWKKPKLIVESDYDGYLYEYTDNAGLSITVTEEQELVTSGVDKLLFKVKSKKLNIARTSSFFNTVDLSKLYSNESVVNEQVRIKNNITRNRVSYTGTLYCVVIDNIENFIKSGIKISEPDLDFVHMSYAINNEFTVAKIGTEEDVLHTEDFLEGIKIDLSHMLEIEPPSNTIIFDFNSNANTNNPYPEVAPSELFFFSSLVRKGNSQTFGPEPSIVVDLARISPLTLDYVVLAKPDFSLNLTRQEFYFSDYSGFLKHLETGVPDKFLYVTLDLSKDFKTSNEDILSNEASANTRAYAIEEIPLHTVINEDNQFFTITFPLPHSSPNETPVARFVSEENEAANFDIGRFVNERKNRVSKLSFENYISAIRGYKPKVDIEGYEISFSDMTALTLLAENSNVLSPDHQFDPKAIVTVLNKTEDLQKNRINALISAADINVFGEKEKLGSIVEDGDLINWTNIDNLIPKNHNVRYVISRINEVDGTMGESPPVHYVTYVEENVFGYGLKRPFQFSGTDVGFDRDDFFFDFGFAHQGRKNTIFDRTVFDVKIEVPSVINHAIIDNFKTSVLERTEISIPLNYVSPFQISSTELTDLSKKLIMHDDVDELAPTVKIEEPIPLLSNISLLAVNDGLEPLSTLVSGGIEPAPSGVICDSFIAQENQKIFQLNIPVASNKDVSVYINDVLISEDDGFGNFNYTVDFENKRITINIVTEDDKVRVCTASVGTFSVTENEIFRKIEVDLLDRFLFFDFDQIIKPWVPVFFKPWLKAISRKWLGDLTRRATTVEEMNLYVQPQEQAVSIAEKIDTIVYFPNTTFLDSSTVLFQEKTTCAKFDVLSRNEFLQYGDKIEPWTDRFIDEYRKYSFLEYVGDRIPIAAATGMANILSLRDLAEITNPIITPITTVYYPNTTFLDSSLNEQIPEPHIEVMNEIIDRNRLFSLRRRIDRVINLPIKKSMRIQTVKAYDKDALPQALVLGETHIESLRTLSDEIKTYYDPHTIVYFGNSTFLDGSVSTFIEEMYEHNVPIFDRNRTFSKRNIIGKWFDREIAGYMMSQFLKDYNKDTLPGVVPLTEPRYVRRIDIDANTKTDIFTTVTFGNTTFLDATSYMTEEFDFENDISIIDRFATFSTNNFINPFLNRDIRKNMRTQILREYNKDTIPSVSVLNEPEITYKPELDAQTVITPITTVSFGNTTFLDATSYMTEEFNFKNDTFIPDRFSIFATQEKISPFLNKDIKEIFRKQTIVEWGGQSIPSVSVLSEPEITYKPELDGTFKFTPFTTVTFGNTTFLDGTIDEQLEFHEYEHNQFILDKNVVMGRNRRIGMKWFHGLIEDYLDVPIVTSDLNYIPSVRALHEPRIIYKPELDLTTKEYHHTTVTFGNTTFLDATIDEQLEFHEYENNHNVISDRHIITKKDFILRKYYEIIDGFLDFTILENRIDINRTVVSEEIHEPTIISQSFVDKYLPKLKTVDDFLIGTQPTFLDASFVETESLTDFSEEIILPVDNSVVSLKDKITDVFLLGTIEKRKNAVISDQIETVRPIPFGYSRNVISSVFEDEEKLVTKLKESSTIRHRESSFVDSIPVLGDEENIEKLFEEINNRNELFDIDKTIRHDFLYGTIDEKKKLKLSDYLEDHIPSVKAELLSKNIFDSTYKISEYNNNNYVNIDSIVPYDLKLHMNATFGVANTFGSVNANGNVDGLGTEINNINNGITLEEFLLNNYVDNFLDFRLKYYDERLIKRRNNYKRYNHSSLKMNYIKNELYTWNISELNTFTTSIVNNAVMTVEQINLLNSTILV